jgi:hypothetical protein
MSRFTKPIPIQEIKREPSLSPMEKKKIREYEIKQIQRKMSIGGLTYGRR